MKLYMRTTDIKWDATHARKLSRPEDCLSYQSVLLLSNVEKRVQLTTGDLQSVHQGQSGGQTIARSTRPAEQTDSYAVMQAVDNRSS